MPPHSAEIRSTATFRELALALAVVAVANLLAVVMTGPSPSSNEVTTGPLIHHAPPTPADAERARANERFGRFFVFVSFNTVAISGLAFAVIARRMEAWRRERLGLPEGLDEGAITPAVVGPGGRPRAASEYRPSVN